MAVRLKQLRTSRTQLRCTRAGARALIYPKGPHEQALFDFVKWCAAEPGYTVVAVHAPRKTAPEALEDVLEDLAACPGVLRLIPATSGSDTTLEFGNWLAQRLGRIVVAHEGKVTIVPGGGLYVPPGETGGAGWLRFEPGSAPVAHSRRFPRPGWDCEPFAEPHALGPHTTVEPLPAGVWIRPVGESPEVDAFRSWLLGGMAPDPLLPRVVLGYPGSPAPPIEAVAEFWHSLPGVLQPAVRFSGFGGTDEGSVSYGQHLADALDAPVVLGNGVQLAEPSSTGGYEMRTVLRQGVMSWPPYVGDLGYLPARSTGGVPADPVAIGHRAPIIGLQEREPGVYEYGKDAVLEVTQSGLWVRPPVLPPDSFSVRTEQADPAHATVVFDASSRASAHRMQLLATEMVQRLEPRVRSTARILASSSTGSLLRDKVTMRVTVMDRSPAAGTAPGALQAPAENGVAPGESMLNLAALTGDAVQTPAPRPVGVDPADLAAGATLHIPIETLLASLTAGGNGLAGPNGVPADGSSWLQDFDDAPVPPAIALYALAWDPDAEDAEPGADLVSRTVAEARNTQPAAPVSLVIDDAPAQTFQPVVEEAIPLVGDAAVEAGPALGTLDASGLHPVLVSASDSAALADPVVDLEPIVITGSPATGAPIAATPPMISEPAGAAAPPATFATTPADTAPAQFTTGPVDAPATQLTSGPFDAAPSQFTPSPVDAPPPAQLAPDPVDVAPAPPAPAAAPAAQFTVARRRLRKGRTATAAPADTEPQGANVVDASTRTPVAPTNDAPTTPAQTPVTPIPAEFVPNAVPAPAPTPAPVPALAAQTPATPQPPASPQVPTTPQQPAPVVQAPASPQTPVAPQASTPVVQAPVAPQVSAPAPAPVAPQAPAAPPAPQPVEEPDEPIQYGAFQLFSSSSGPTLGAPSAPAAPAPERQRPVVPPTPPAAERARPATPAAPPAPGPTGPVTPPPAPPIGNAPAAPVQPTPSPQRQAPVAPAPRPAQPQPLPMQQPQPVPPAAPAGQPSAPAANPAAPPAPAAVPVAPAPAPALPVQPQPQPPLIETALPAQAPTAPPIPATPAAQPAKRRPARPAKSTVRIQPVPTAQCSVMPREGGLAKERDWLRRNLSKQYDATASSVARILSEYPGLRAGSSASDIEVLTDLVALRLYLTGKISGLDAAVRGGQVGPHVPLARCVASGLRRLPSYRGPLRTRASLTTEQVQWYANRSLVTEWSFFPAVASPALDLPGSVEILIWSMTGRRTGLLDPSRADQVVFQPGTSFKVLSVGTGRDGPELLLRELTRTEVAPDGTVQSIPALDEFASAALEETGKAWRQADPVEDLPADRRDWFASPPGLLAPGAPAGPAGPAGGAKEGGKA
jgi:hypothetical protein